MSSRPIIKNMVFPPCIAATQPQNSATHPTAPSGRARACFRRLRARGRSPNRTAPPNPLAPANLHSLAPLLPAQSSLTSNLRAGALRPPRWRAHTSLQSHTCRAIASSGSSCGCASVSSFGVLASAVAPALGPCRAPEVPLALRARVRIQKQRFRALFVLHPCGLGENFFENFP